MLELIDFLLFQSKISYKTQCLRTIMSVQNFNIPSKFGSERLDTVIALLNALKGSKEVIIDWGAVKLVEPAGFTLISLIVDQAIEKNCRLIHKNVPQVLKEVLKEKTSLGKIKNTLPPPTSHDKVGPDSFQLCCQGAIDMRYKEILINRFSGLDEDLRFSIQLVFNELIQNTVDHSTSERYYLYFGLLNDEIHFGVLDMGISLPAKLEQKYEAGSDEGFIELSVKEGPPTRRQRPGGLGLFHTFEIIKDLQGKFVLISRDGQIRRYFAQRKINRSKLKNRLNGTWAMFTFKNQKASL